MIVEIHSNQLILAIGSYIVKHCDIDANCESAMRVERVDSRQEDGSRIVMSPGIGRFHFSFGEETCVFERVSEGDPVTARSYDHEAVVHEKVRIIASSSSVVQNLCNVAVDVQEADIEEHYQTFTWNSPSEYWQRATYAPIRSMKSVVLEDSLIDDILSDMDDFTSQDTRQWYRQHSIPFRRGYLLHGPPGTGKTSLISAMASHLNRRLHRLSLTAPKLTDDLLLLAVNSTRNPAIIVMEDIDSLFDTHREKKELSGVTFSGLLNAIDGIGDTSKGTIFIFTTNHPERLDPALCRKGRVDRKFRLGHMTANTSKKMFLRFYPDHFAEADAFTKSVMVGSPPTPAELQHHFITHRKSRATAATVFKRDETMAENMMYM